MSIRITHPDILLKGSTLEIYPCGQRICKLCLLLLT